MPRSSIAVAVLVPLLAVLACHRTVEDEPQVELIEHRIEPCRTMCDYAHDPECGLDPPPNQTADQCFEDCASHGGQGFQWAHQEDGTDACAQEWLARVRCFEALDCEGRYSAFNDASLPDEQRPCKAETSALADCFYSTPNLEREEPPP